MIKRFEGAAGRAALEDALSQQRLVLGNDALASRLADVGSLLDVAAGQVLITQGAQDNDVYFIITGRFQVQVHGREVASRGPTEHVGEMSVLVATAARSATVLATEPSCVLKVSASDYKNVANDFPRLWQQITRQLVERLHQRNNLVRPAHQSARVFIICSVEALHIARAVENHFEHDKFFVKIWTEGVFRASRYPIESLEEQLDESDFAIAIPVAMLAYTGVETVSNLAEEARDPVRSVPNAYKLVAGAVFAIYFTLPLVALSAMPVEEINGELTTRLALPPEEGGYANDPILGLVENLGIEGLALDAMKIYVGILAGTILVIATNAGVIGASRITYSMSNYRQMPEVFRRPRCPTTGRCPRSSGDSTRSSRPPGSRS